MTSPRRAVAPIASARIPDPVEGGAMWCLMSICSPNAFRVPQLKCSRKCQAAWGDWV